MQCQESNKNDFFNALISSGQKYYYKQEEIYNLSKSNEKKSDF